VSLSNPALAPRYEVADRPPVRIADILLRWETVLVLLLIAVIIFNASISPYFLDFYNLSDATFNFSE
jgi:rhamnose transport system permease protein